MKKVVASLFLVAILFLLLSACSANDNDAKSEMDFDAGSDEMAIEMDKSENMSENDESADKKVETTVTNRMIIHKAELQLNVKNLENAQLNIERKVSEYEGYIVESNVYRENKEHVSGKITVRVPENHFQRFISDAVGEAAEVLTRNVTGQDITEQYVDLESRVKSKRAVEERLFEFMANAEKTEDLLKISSDLSKIQEEIELILGKMNFLENQTSYSTIEITMFENRVIVPGLDGNKLDTWEKTKKQLATSTNLLFATGSGLIVFFIGNLPVIILFLLIGGMTYFMIRRKKKRS